MSLLRLTLTGTLVVVVLLEYGGAAIFDQPRPLSVWEDLPRMPESFERPKSYDEKNFGQWCRNMTTNTQTQCPRGSPFHWYVCCGKDNTECCFGVQTWCYVVFGLFIISNIITGTVALLAHFDVVFRNKKQTKKLSTGDYKSVDTNSSPA
ncbi:Protein C08H9.15 [Aphelenchoides avenae]|nr:Protein C08H9.15 [Aphelenchus avenae]